MDAKFSSFFERGFWFWHIARPNGSPVVASTKPHRYQADQLAEIDMVLDVLQKARSAMVEM